MFARLSAFVIWSLVAATVVFWALRLAASPSAVPPYAVPVGNSVAMRGDLARLFGAPLRAAVTAQATEGPSRFKLLGVMAPRSPAEQAEPGQGLALIAVDGKPAKAYAVGARLDSDIILQSVGLRTAALGTAHGGRSVLLELPALAPPNAGVLPSLSAGVAPTAAAPVPPAANNRMQAAQAALAAQAAQAAQGGVAAGAPPAGVPPLGLGQPIVAPGAPSPAATPNMPQPGSATVQ
jgi:general secretion pathway protein C